MRIYDSLGEPAERRLAELASHHVFAQASTLRTDHVRRRTESDESTGRDRLTMLDGRPGLVDALPDRGAGAVTP